MWKGEKKVDLTISAHDKKWPPADAQGNWVALGVLITENKDTFMEHW